MPDEIALENIPRKNNLQDKISRSPIKRREFYEEIVEQKQHERHAALTKHFCKAKKKYEQFQSQLKQITKINKKDSIGPEWYQELSDKQENLLDGFNDHMKEDYDLGTSKSTRKTLKALGVRTFIPHTVAMDALIASQLYPVPFLTAIKDYVMQKNDSTDVFRSNQRRRVYSTEERILMSSILYMAFPCLIKKLDYCLNDPVPDKKLEYIKLPKSERKSTKYSSPYLEPLPEPVQPWTEVEKIKSHNTNVKAQIDNENAKYEKKKLLEEMELEADKKAAMKMTVTFPEHPLEKMFYDPPLMTQYNRKNPHYENMKTRNKKNIHKDTSTSEGESISPKQLLSAYASPSRKLNIELIKNEHQTNNKKRSSQSSISTAAGKQNIKSHNTMPPSRTASVLTQPSKLSLKNWRSTDNGTYKPEKPRGWLMKSYSLSSVSIDSSHESSTDDLSIENTNKALEVIDFDGPVRSFNVQHNCNSPIRNENNTESAGDINALCSEGLGEMKLPNIDEEEKKIWQAFRKFGVVSGSSESSTCSNRNLNDQKPVSQRSEKTFITDVTIMNMEQRASKTISTKTLPRTPPRSKRCTENGEEEEENNRCSDISLVEKMSVIDLAPNENENTSSREFLPSSFDDNVSATEQRQNIINEDSVNLDEILVELRKLSSWKQLKAALQFLSILGDPIAGFPDLVDFDKLRRWYEERLNINRHMTLKLKQDLMSKSVAAWNSSRPKMSTIPISNIHVKKNSAGNNTWDQINETKQKTKMIKNEYITKVKQMAISNARDIFPTMKSEYYKNRLNKNFKQTFYDYFPAKEDDCIFDNVLTESKLKKNAKENN